MDVPLELSFHQVDSSETVEQRIRERAAKLDRLYDHIASCRVAVEAPHRQHRKGNQMRVRIDISVPGKELVVTRSPHRPEQTYADPDVYALVNDAFDAAERQIKEFKAKHKREAKPHDAPMTGQVLSIAGDRDHGFLRSADGRELYFHRNSLTHEALESLAAGDRVHYLEVAGDTGPHASKVWRVADGASG
ncbi:MAG: 30S ribosomal protein S30 [Rhodospirillaceae bacterium]|nr:30S ribosomal protein S30 [Rhodospirillaceae bacterium]